MKEGGRREEGGRKENTCRKRDEGKWRHYITS